jgi:tetratricopeptide (TPR) repeat protein
MQATNVDYGAVVREARMAKGWSRADLAEVYGRFFHDDSISEDTIRMWEDYNKVPKKAKRRQVLAFLLDLPVAALGIESLASLALKAPDRFTIKGIDVASAATKLQEYKTLNHASTVGPLLTDILGTIHDIHDEIPYVSATKRTQFLGLLCDYQQFVAGLYRDKSQYDEALFYQNKAYAVAKTLNDPEQLALVLWRRGITYDCQGNLEAAIADFLAAQRYQTKSVNLQGAIWASLGHAQAHNAKDSSEHKAALLSFDRAERLLDRAQREPDDYFIKFNVEGYHLNRASAWIGAADKKLRSPDRAFEALTLVPVDENRKRRYAFSAYVQARCWFEMGDYPIATQLALDAVTIAGEIQSHVNVNHIADLYQELRETSYGKSPAVAELGLQLIRVQNPSLLA